MTNGDKIRQMSDEELAPYITCPYDECIDLVDCSCKCCILKWLKEEAREDG